MIRREDLDELDRVCCELDDLRPRAVMTAAAWGESDLISPGRPVSSAASPKAHLLGVAGPVDAICPWCAWERAAGRRESCERLGLVRIESCERHAAQLVSSEVKRTSPSTPAGDLRGRPPFLAA
jgi:hypothetical protein